MGQKVQFGMRQRHLCKGCSFCQEEPPTPAPTAPCKAKCTNTYEKFAKKGKEGVGYAKVCEQKVCQGCSFCEQEPPTPAPTAPCRATCKNTYDKFAKIGKEGVGYAKVCEQKICQGCSFCEQDFPTPAPTGPCQERCQGLYDKFAKQGKASEGKETVCGKYACSGCSLCTDDEAVEHNRKQNHYEPRVSPFAGASVTQTHGQKRWLHRVQRSWRCMTLCIGIDIGINIIMMWPRCSGPALAKRICINGNVNVFMVSHGSNLTEAQDVFATVLQTHRLTIKQ